MKTAILKQWSVYMVLCNDNSLYTGISNDVAKRFTAHQSGKGARYTKIRGAQKIVYTKIIGDHVAALKRELEIKKYSRKKKEQLILGGTLK